MNIKDLVYALFGNYANSATTNLISQKEFMNNAANGIKFAGTGLYNSKNKKDNIKKLSTKQMKVFKATFGTRSEIFDAIDIVKYLDITQQIIETVVNDAFYSFDSKEPFTVKYTGNSYDQDEINKMIQRTIKRLKLYTVFRDIAEDFVTYGEYYLETPCKTGLGILELNDTVFVNNVVSVYDNSELLYHVAERKTAYGTEIVQIDKDALSHFIVGSKPIRTHSGKFDGVLGVPEIVKVGKSILLPVLKLLQRYNILDVASVANDLKTALMPPILKLATGESNPEQMMEAVKRYEEYFKEMGDVLHDLDASKEIGVNQILDMATEVKILPGNDKSGGIEKTDFGSDSNLNESQDRLIARIKSTIGIPTDEESKSRLDNLREKSRYAKKLLDIQNGCGESMINLIQKDLKYQGVIIDTSNLEVAFKAIQNPNIEEDAEGMFHLATSARDVIRTYVETAEDISGLRLNPKAAKNFLDSLMSRYPQCAGMLETDEFGDLADEPENAEATDQDDFDERDSGDFIEKSDGTENGPETVGSEPEEPLIEPEETEEPEEPEIEEPTEPEGES